MASPTISDLIQKSKHTFIQSNQTINTIIYSNYGAYFLTFITDILIKMFINRNDAIILLSSQS